MYYPVLHCTPNSVCICRFSANVGWPRFLSPLFLGAAGSHKADLLPENGGNDLVGVSQREYPLSPQWFGLVALGWTGHRLDSNIWNSRGEKWQQPSNKDTKLFEGRFDESPDFCWMSKRKLYKRNNRPKTLFVIQVFLRGRSIYFNCGKKNTTKRKLERKSNEHALDQVWCRCTYRWIHIWLCKPYK